MDIKTNKTMKNTKTVKVDEQAVWTAKQLFEFLGCRDLKIIIEDEFSHHDIQGYLPDGERIQIEVKGRREYVSTAFPDHMVGADKMYHLTSACTSTHRVVASVYKDDVVKVTRVDNLEMWETTNRRKAPHTTEFGKKELVWKYDVSLKPDAIYQLTFDGDGKITEAKNILKNDKK